MAPDAPPELVAIVAKAMARGREERYPTAREMAEELSRYTTGRLVGAYLYLTRIEGSDLSGVLGLTQWQVDVACGDGDTKLPEGLSRPPDWPCGD